MSIKDIFGPLGSQDIPESIRQPPAPSPKEYAAAQTTGTPTRARTQQNQMNGLLNNATSSGAGIGIIDPLMSSVNTLAEIVGASGRNNTPHIGICRHGSNATVYHLSNDVFVSMQIPNQNITPQVASELMAWMALLPEN